MDVPAEDELMTGREIAEELEWADVGTAASLARKGTFPQPVIDKRRFRLWLRADVEHWAATATRRPRK